MLDDDTKSLAELEQNNRDFFANLASKELELLKTHKSLQLSVTSLFDAMCSQRSRISYRKEAERTRFRGSDLPFCPMKFMLDNVRTNTRYEDVRFMSEFYTANGDAFHATIQKWLGVSGKMYGKWRCPTCNNLYPKKSTEDDNIGMFGPVTCCGEPTGYHELHVVGKHFSGHMDGLIELHGKFLVCEFKQMGSSIFQRRLTQGYDKHHYYQAQVYRTALPKFMELPEDRFHDYVLLWYFDRGDCRVNQPWIIPHDPNVYAAEVAKVVATKKSIKRGKYHACEGICKTSQDNIYCPYNNLICFAEPQQKQRMLQALIPTYGDS